MAGFEHHASTRAMRINNEKKPHITETPISWKNWYQHVNWLSVFFIIIVPLMGLVAASLYPLQRATAIFAVVYYFNTGLGITAGTYCDSLPAEVNIDHFIRIPPPVGSFIIQGLDPLEDIPRSRWRRRSPGFHPMVVQRPSCASSLYGYRKRPLLRAKGSLIFPHRVDGDETES